ncbi:MAG TPA: DUF3592 domain-containing protein [Phycisphaerales bacterium]|nr:DUF3592 domain-containing protein [Phycisphaerales bacterium]HMP37666.1 DUF3592 domain-containing protein [Phycisphaerales bacterium]
MTEEPIEEPVERRDPQQRDEGRSGASEAASRDAASAGDDPDVTTVPAEQRSFGQQVAAVIAGGGFAVLAAFSMVLAIGWVVWILVAGHVRAAQATLLWQEAEGLVSEVSVSRVAGRQGISGIPRGLARKVRVLFHGSEARIEATFEASGSAHVARGILGYQPAFIWRPAPGRIVDGLAIGSPVRVRFDPDAPHRAEIDLGIAGWRFTELLVLLPIGGAALLLLREWALARRARRDPLGGRLVLDGTGGVRVRFALWTCWSWGMLGLVIGTGSVLISLFVWAGREPSVEAVVGAALAAASFGVGAALLREVWLRRGRNELCVDDVRRVLVLPAASPAASSDGSAGRESPRALSEPRFATHLEGGAVGRQQIPFSAIESVEAISEGGWRIRLGLRDQRSRAPGVGPSEMRTVDLPVADHGAQWIPPLAEWIEMQVNPRKAWRS